MREFLADPRLFNFLIMVLYIINSGRWLMAKSYGDACYWASAFLITASVTWGYQR